MLDDKLTPRQKSALKREYTELLENQTALKWQLQRYDPEESVEAFNAKMLQVWENMDDVCLLQIFSKIVKQPPSNDISPDMRGKIVKVLEIVYLEDEEHRHWCSEVFGKLKSELDEIDGKISKMETDHQWLKG